MIIIKLFKKYSVFFTVGALGYAAIELLWRGRTHWSMMIAGGIAFIIFSLVCEGFPKRPLIIKAILAAVGICALELAFGMLFNIALGMKIWDYSDRPLNLFGQICPGFTVLWILLALIFLPLADLLNRKLG